jgi:hypothetical protein
MTELIKEGLERFNLTDEPYFVHELFTEMVLMCLKELAKDTAHGANSEAEAVAEVIRDARQDSLEVQIIDLATQWSNDMSDRFICYLRKEGNETMEGPYRSTDRTEPSAFMAIYDWLRETHGFIF